MKIAVLPPGASRSAYDMTPAQREHTSDTRCIISLAITEGLGDALWRKGVLNVSTSNPSAEEVWASDERVADDVAYYLVGLAHIIVDRGLLPD